MRNKGFTLIELLAVIVILSIIALIAVPIILNIINDSKKESNQRSIDMYADAIKNAVAKYQLDGKKLEVSKLKTTDGRNFTNIEDFKIDYEGNVVCETIEVYEDGNIYLAKCEVNDEPVEYTYGSKQISKPVSFAEDSWETIAKAVTEGDINKYKVGDTKEIKLEGFTNEEENSKGLYTVRIANTSTPNECETNNFSQTACGFVVEFVDIITKHNMNPAGKYKETQYDYGWNVEGYPASEMYKYIKNDIFNLLPEELTKVIIDTKVVSSHGDNTGEKNFETTDKLYLLSTKEVSGSNLSYDTSAAKTRQLDYYKASTASSAIKKENGNAGVWWLRSAKYDTTHRFYLVHAGGGVDFHNANRSYGVAPAFRIG